MKTIIEMAKEAGIYCTDRVRDFAELVRADEREACEMAIEELPPDAVRSDCAAAIRARGNT